MRETDVLYDEIDIYDINASFDEDEVNADSERGTFVSPEEALVKTLNSCGRVDMRRLEEMTGLNPLEIAAKLRGAIFQKPEKFGDEKLYNPYDFWTISADYLSGNIRWKLETAEQMNRKFYGRFESNISALKSVLPSSLDIKEIHINLGASWIPTSEYEDFIADFLHFKDKPEVCFYKELSTVNVIPPKESSNSVLNTITYGVRAGKGNLAGHQYLTACNIIEQTINAKTIKVYDSELKGFSSSWSYEYEPIFNREKTLEAQEKGRHIEDAFRDWVYASSARIARFEGYYNDAFVGYTAQVYNGDFLTLPDLNPEVKLYKHQRDAIARILLSGTNTLLAHDVGTGKTYEMIVAAHELYRMGLSKKNLIVVPNNVLTATVEAHKYLYENDSIYAVFPKDFTPDKRTEVLDKIANGDYVAVYMAYSSFDMIGMSKQYYITQMVDEIRKLRVAANNTELRHEKSALEGKVKRVAKKLRKFRETEPESLYLPFEKLGIETLIVDEAHNYKNIGVYSRSDNIVGMAGSGSKKCREMFEKVKNVNRCVFATGTPLTNSLADLYVFQSYLQPKTLEYNKVNTFDMWINTFGQREACIECDVDSNSKNLRMVTRFSSFHNLGELMGMFSLVCDFHHMPEDEEGLPAFDGAVDIIIPKNEAQTEYINELSERTDAIRKKEVSRHEDNLLKVTGDGRKAALDIRLVLEASDGYRGEYNKIDACAEQIMKIHKLHPDSSQVVFSDIGTPKDSFNVYDALKAKLIELGMKESEIAFVHDATNERDRAKLFSDMNKGKLKVVVGSTQKLGVGVNVQERLVALHHLSVPWRPADMVQREGRILRKGNTSEKVYMFRYITQGTFDAYSWQLLESKQKFISSFLSGISGERESDDVVADLVLTYGEVKALAIGNPLIKKRVEVANKLERTKITYRGRQKQLIELRSVAERLPEDIKRYDRLSAIAGKDADYYAEYKESISNEERIAFGEELLCALKDNLFKPEERLFDNYQGFSVILPANMSEEYPHVLIRSENGGNYYCDMKGDKTPLGCNKTIDYLLEHLKERQDNLKKQSDNAQMQLKDAKADLQNENPYLAEIEVLKEQLDGIDLELAKITDDEEEKAS